MAGRYERVTTHDDSDADTEPSTPIALPTGPRQAHPIPNSPPPSFHSRASSHDRRHAPVNADLADAFDTDGSDSDDDEPDDRRRLVRGNSTPDAVATPTSSASAASAGIASGGISVSTAELRAATHQPAQQAAVRASAGGSRIYGGGIQSDGVFSNLTAKPERGEAEKEEQPPTYEQAAADAAPPYWETTILAPGLGGPDEVYIDGMPVGSLFSFVWNGMISTSFQLVGFLLTYLLHSTHAAKNGSRAGLGITMIQYGFYMKGTDGGAGPGSAAPPQMSGPDGYASPPDPNSHDFDPNAVASSGDGGSFSDITGSEWIAYVLMVVGWFILIRSVSDYLRARRHEQLVLQSPDRGLGVAVIADGEHPERVV